MNKDNVYIEKLVSKAALGDECAWSELYNKTFRNAYFVAIKITNNEDNAIELVHDAFITAFDKVNQLEDKSKFQSWLNMIVANKCRDFLRKRKPVLFSDMETEDGMLPEWEDEHDDSRPEEMIDKQETVRLIAEIIETLPEDQKLCIMMYYWNELSVSEIANSLEVSEGTVKSRLNNARIKIKAKVEELEKKGTKLYGLAPIPLVVWLLKTEASAMTIPASAATAPTLVSSGVATATTAIGVATTTTNTVAGAVTKSIMSGIVGKIVAGVAAVSLVLGGAGVYNHIQNKDDSNLAESAYALYEELLSKGVTDNGLKITHYAYVDLGSDGIPELIVSDSDIIPKTIFGCECFTIKDKQVYSFGHSGAYYDYIYLINDGEYIAGSSRLGQNFINADESIDTTLYKWDEAMTRNDPAISYNGGKWEYITKEEFDYYNTMPDDSDTEGFIKTAEIIKFNENTFSKQNVNEDYSVWNGKYSGGGVKDGEYVIGQWHATISNATEKAINISLSISESDFYIEDATLYKQEDNSYYGRGVTMWGDEQNIKIQMETSNCIFVTVITIDTGYKNAERLYKE